MKTSEEITSGVLKMRRFFMTNETKTIRYRREALQRLYHSVKQYENELMDSLYEDLNKSVFESYSTEISLVLKEISCQLNYMKRWSKPKKAGTPFMFFPSKSKIVKEPYGVVLVIAPWNYPFQLLFMPLVAAIAAGNCVVLKTSPQVPVISRVMHKIITETFPREHVTIFHGNRDINALLLAERFDYIFFTGSPSVGKVVMTEAAKFLTPVTLELGGKSPCIVDYDADLRIAARRIIWGKCINSGQTCIAPDYLLVHKNVKADLMFLMQKTVREMYGEYPQDSPDYPRIISAVAMNRLVHYLDSGTVVFGGKYNLDDNYFEPTVIENVPEDAPVLREEIFGPIFPLIEFETTEEAIRYVKEREKPLALYYFSKDRKSIKKVLRETSSGGACINDTIIHVANHRIPFGGVGNSGMGNYHGKFGFDTFSHEKAVVTSSSFIDLKLKYPPYSGKLQKLKRFM